MEDCHIHKHGENPPYPWVCECPDPEWEPLESPIDGKVIDGKFVSHGELWRVYVQPGGCIEVSTAYGGDEGIHVCEWTTFVAGIEAEIQRRIDDGSVYDDPRKEDR